MAIDDPTDMRSMNSEYRSDFSLRLAHTAPLPDCIDRLPRQFRPRASSTIFRVRDWLQMVGIDAGSVPAQMIQDEATRHRPVLNFKKKLMDFHVPFTASAPTKDGITSALCSCPFPASRFRDPVLALDSLKNGLHGYMVGSHRSPSTACRLL